MNITLFFTWKLEVDLCNCVYLSSLCIYQRKKSAHHTTHISIWLCGVVCRHFSSSAKWWRPRSLLLNEAGSCVLLAESALRFLHWPFYCGNLGIKSGGKKSKHVPSDGQETILVMATHSSVLAWRIPGTREPGGLLSVGSHGVGHDWASSLSPTLINSSLNLATSSIDSKAPHGLWWVKDSGKAWLGRCVS